MPGDYVPMAQRTPEQREAYRSLHRIKNRRWHARKRERANNSAILQQHLEEHGTVSCTHCGIEVVPVCGFCLNGLSDN